MENKGLKITIPEKVIPKVVIPEVTLDYYEELEKSVKNYMEDRFNYLAAGRHILDDLSSSPYVEKLYNIFQEHLDYNKIANDFNKLGQEITDKKNQKALDKRFEKHGIEIGLSDEELKDNVNKISELREEFIKTKPTKGWNTKKMEIHRKEFEEKVFKLFNFKVIKYGKVENSSNQVPLVDKDKWIYTQDIFPQSDWGIKRNYSLKIVVTWSTNKKRWEKNDLFEFEYVKKGLDHSNYIRINNRIINLKK